MQVVKSRQCKYGKGGWGDIYLSSLMGLRLMCVSIKDNHYYTTPPTTTKQLHRTTMGSTDSSSYYAYSPSLPLAATFTAVFSVLLLTHTFRLFHTRTWFMIPFVLGCLFEAVGYIGRILGAIEAPGPYSLAPYLISAVLILIAPTLFAASIYMELGRVVEMVKGEDVLVMRRKWLTKVSPQPILKVNFALTVVGDRLSY